MAESIARSFNCTHNIRSNDVIVFSTIVLFVFLFSLLLIYLRKPRTVAPCENFPLRYLIYFDILALTLKNCDKQTMYSKTQAIRPVVQRCLTIIEPVAQRCNAKCMKRHDRKSQQDLTEIPPS